MRKEKITAIFDELKEICNEKNLKIEDTTLMDFSVRIYLSEFIKDSGKSDASDAQKNLLRNKGVEIKPGLSKKEASDMINRILNKERQ